MRFDPNAYGEDTVMICESESDVETFTDYLDFIRKTWNTGDSYPSDTKWRNVSVVDSGIAYYFNKGTYSSKTYAEQSGECECLYFGDFDWEDAASTSSSYLQSTSLDDFLNAFINKGE